MMMKLLSLAIMASLLIGCLPQMYSPLLSYQLLQYSRIAYEDPRLIQAWTCFRHCSFVQAHHPSTFQYAGNSGFVAYNPAIHSIVATFKGSDYDEPTDWVTNAFALKDDFPFCKYC